MSVLAPFLVSCALLVAAGSAKALRPRPTAMALSPLLGWLGVQRASWAVRVLATCEATLGVVGGLYPQRIPAAAIALSFAGFACFVIYARRRGGVLATCGCFSKPDTPPTRTHIALDLGLAACAVAVSAQGSSRTLWSYLAHQPLDGVPMLSACGLCAWLVFMVLVDLPRLGAAGRALGEGS